MGDALAVALLKARGFTREDFALTHPGGNLGKQLLLRVSDIMLQNDELPLVLENTTIKEAIYVISQKQCGLCLISDNEQNLHGIFTDGDLRRTLNKQLDIASTKLADVFTPTPKTCRSDTLAAEALRIMEKNSISSIPVVDDNNKVVGLISFRDLLKAGVI